MQQWYDRPKKSKPLRCDGRIIDLDGVIWRGGEPIEGAADAIAAIRAIGTRVLFLTSDPGSSRPQLAARLMENGIGATSAYVMTSAASTARIIGTMEDLPSRRALVVGPRARHAEIQSTGAKLGAPGCV